MKHIVTSGTYTPVTRELLEAKPNRYKEEDGDLVDLLQSDIPNSYDRITLHKWDFKGEIKIIKGEYVIFDFDPKEKDKDIEDKLDEIIVALNKVVGLNRDHLTIIFTGRGYHVLVKTIYDINRKFLKDTKKSYKEICKKLQKELDEEGVEVDDIFSKWHIRTRIPGRHNEKNNKEVKLIQVADHSYADDFLAIRTPEENQQAREQIAITDPNRVLSECEFISKFKARPNKSYNEWLALGSILVKLPDGEKLVHDYSKEDCDGGYSEEETNNKIPEFKKLNFGCGTIDGLWDGCKECPHYRTIKSPTDLGKVHDGGRLRQVKDPSKLDVVKCADALLDEKLVIFDPSNKIKTVDSAGFYRYYENLRHWKYSGLMEARALVDKMVRKDCSSPFANIKQTLGDYKHILDLWYLKYNKRIDTPDINPKGFLNFPNGILNTRTGDFFQDDNVIFDYVLDYDYDPDAKATYYHKLMSGWMENVEYQTETLERYVGLSFMGLATDTEKFVILSGKTRNGKSMFFNVLKEVFSEGLTSSLSMGGCTHIQMNNQLIGKLLNVCDESSRDENDENGVKSIPIDWEKAKQLASGQPMESNPKYQQPFTFCNKAGIIISQNKIWEKIPNDPAIRARIVPLRFPNGFCRKDNPDKHISPMEIMENIRQERAGIMNYFLEKGRKCLQEGLDLKVAKEVEQLSKTITDHESITDRYFNSVMEMGKDTRPRHEWATSNDIYEHYVSWYNSERNPERYRLGKTTFQKKLPKHFLNMDKHHTHVGTVNNSKRYDVILNEIEMDSSF